MQVVSPDLLGRPRAEDAGRQLREACRGVPQLHRRQQLRKPRLHGDGAGIAPRGVLLPLRELVGHALVGAVLQEASEQQVTGFQQLQVLDVVAVVAWEQARGFQVEQRGSHDEELRHLVERLTLAQLARVGDEFVRDFSKRYFGHVQLLRLDQAEQ